MGILEEYLTEFRGCVIVISHDRYFLDNIVDHLFVMEGNGVIRDFRALHRLSHMARRTGTQGESRSAGKNRHPRTARTGTENDIQGATRIRSPRGRTRGPSMPRKPNSKLSSLPDSGAQPDEFARRSARYAEISDIIDEKRAALARTIRKRMTLKATAIALALSAAIPPLSPPKPPRYYGPTAPLAPLLKFGRKTDSRRRHYRRSRHTHQRRRGAAHRNRCCQGA